MAVESFRHIEYSNANDFVRQDGRIELKEYQDNILFYADYDSVVDATFGVGDSSAAITGTAYTANNGAFAQHLFIQNGTVSYNKNNFATLTNKGTLKFRIKPDFNNAPGQQEFVLTSNPFITALPDIDNTAAKFGGGSLELVGSEEKRISYDVANISSITQIGTIDFFVKSNYDGTPSTRTTFLDIYNGTTDNNRITIYHEVDGNLYFRIYDQNGSLVVNVNFAWSFNSSNWYNFAFNFDLNAGASRAFIDGAQYGLTDTNTGTRVALVGGYLGVGSTTPAISDSYIDDFAIFSVVRNTANYTIRNIAYTGTEASLVVYAKYDTSINLDVGSVPAPSSTTPVNSDYNFKLAIDGTYYTGGDISVSLETDDTMTDVFNKIAAALTGANATINLLSGGNIRILANTDGATISIEEPDSGRSLLQLLGGVSEAILPNGPTTNTNLITLTNQTNNNNKVILTHTNDSHLLIKMYNSSGVLKVDQDMGVWSNDNIAWTAFELDWNKTIGQFYIDGNLFSVFQTGFTRSDDTALIITAGADAYRIDEFIIYNDYLHDESYAVETYPLTPYAANDPYIDIYFGSGFQENQVTDLNLNCSVGCNFVVKLDNTWYYYYSGAWRQSDGSYSQSVSPSAMETKFAQLYFNENQELVVRVYFHSDGLTNVWIDEISIITETTDESAAVITGTVDLCSPVDLSSDQHVTITTDQGSAEVDLTTEVPGLPAEHVGTTDMSSGYAWATNGAETFIINTTTINLNQNTTSVTEVINLISGQAPNDVIIFDDGSGHIGIKTVDTGAAVTLDLSEGTGGLARLGMTDNTYTGSDPDLTSVTLQEIKDAIDAANIPGLAPASDDANCHLVLMSTDTGSNSYIAISEGVTSNALDVVWGFEASDSGEEPTGVYFDYSNIYEWIREMLGAPTVPVELTDDQLENCIGRAVYWYNYYRNAKENLITITLEGNETDGYKIPQEVGGEENIIEIIVRPRFPFAYYTGGDVNSIMTNLYLQWMFQRGRNTTQFKDFIGDYYITLSAEKDYENILGTRVQWHFYNGKMYISPKPAGMKVGIIFKSAVSIGEINTNSLIRSYALGEAKQILGQIRATFGSTIPGGTENIQLRGEALIAEGKEEANATLEKMMKLSEPLFLEWG